MYKSEHIITSKHYLILTVIAFSFGIYLAASSDAIPLILSTFLLVVLFAMLLICFLVSKIFVKSNSRHTKLFLLPMVLIVCVFFGILRILVAEAISPSSLKKYLDKEVWLSGTISSPVTETSTKSSSYFEFRINKADENNISPETIVMYIPNFRSADLSEGDYIRCWTKLSLPEREDENDNFDYFSHLRSKNIFYIGRTKNATLITEQTTYSLTDIIFNLGNKIKNRTVVAIDGLIPENKKYASILKGIVIGDKTDFSDNLYNKFSNSGLSHIVAVSGLHLSVLFSLITLFLFKVRIHRKIAYILAIPIIILFSSATEFTPSVCRSVIMVIAMIISTLLGERYSPINALFLSMGIILMISPYSLFSKSLMLSFGATLGILVCFGHLQTLWNNLFSIPEPGNNIFNLCLTKSKKFLGSSLAVSVSAFVGTVYLCAIFFGSISKVQFLTNLWVVPVANLTFCLGCLACLCYYILPHLSVAIFFYPLRLLLFIITSTANTFGSDKFAYKIHSEISPIFFVIYLMITLLFYLLIKTFSDIQKEKAVKKMTAKECVKNS